MTTGYFTRDEILSQTEAWSEAIQVASQAPPLEAAAFDSVMFTGCGSAYYLSLAAAALYEELTGRPARAVPAGELVLNADLATRGSALSRLLVAFSRSGTTTETVRAVQHFKEGQGGRIVSITNTDATLLQLADVRIFIPKGAEQSIAQTRAFTSMYLAAVTLCARMAGRTDLLAAMSSLPEIGSHLLRTCESASLRFGTDLNLDRFYFLGSGIRHGLACEANLKMKEMTLTHSEAFHFLEIRHGPMSMVGPSAVVVGLLSEKNHAQETAVLKDMQSLGAATFTLGESGTDLAFQSGLPEAIRGVLYLPALQLTAFHRSLAKGLNPDHPHNLTAVVHLSL